MALTHNPNSQPAAIPRQFLVASPYLSGTLYDRKVALIVEAGRHGHRGVVVNEAFRKSLLAAHNSMQGVRASRLDEPEAFELGLLAWGPGKLEDEIRSGVWMPTATTMETVLADHDDLWADMVRGIGRSVLRDSLGITQFPRDLRLN